MDDAAKLAKIKLVLGITDNTQDALLTVYLDDAKNAIMERRYPFGAIETEMPERYDTIQCRLAERYYVRRGGEGEISHSENGITRSYASTNDGELLGEVTQIVGLR